MQCHSWLRQGIGQLYRGEVRPLTSPSHIMTVTYVVAQEDGSKARYAVAISGSGIARDFSVYLSYILMHILCNLSGASRPPPHESRWPPVPVPKGNNLPNGEIKSYLIIAISRKFDFLHFLNKPSPQLWRFCESNSFSSSHRQVDQGIESGGEERSSLGPIKPERLPAFCIH